MAITLSTISPALLDAGGGTRLEITGDFSAHLGAPFYAELVPSGGGTALRALTGRPGLPNDVYPLNSTRMVCYAPQVDASITYDLTVTLISNGAVTDTLASAIVSLPKQYNLAVFNYRRALPPTYIVGPRTFEQLERIP